MWKDWLALSKREQKGFVVLSVIFVLLVLFYLFIPVLFPVSYEKYEDEGLNKWLDSLNRSNEQLENKPDSLFFFDPNTVSISDLEKLGVKGHGLINFLKYRESGLKFKTPGDLLKIYSIDSSMAIVLMEYVRIDKGSLRVSRYYAGHEKIKHTGKSIRHDSSVISRYHVARKAKEPDFRIEINSADTSEFTALNGIGQVLSARIVSYRKVLGGFYDVEQLKEVYGMPAETIDRNKVHLAVDTSLVKKININRASLRRLKNHPYVGFYLARAIVEYRKKHGRIERVEEVLSFKEVKEDQKVKLKEYLSVK